MDSNTPKVAMITDLLWAGGAQTVARSLVNALSTQDFPVTLYYERLGYIQTPPFAQAIIPNQGFMSPQGDAYGKLIKNWRAKLIDEFDIVHFHNLHSGHIPEELPFHLAKQMPVFWTLHDLAGFTGGCKFPAGCNNWHKYCIDCNDTIAKGRCFSMSSNVSGHERIQYLRELWGSTEKPQLIVPCRWERDQILSSPLGDLMDNISVIPNGVDTRSFYPINKNDAKDSLSLPTNMPLVTLCANNFSAPLKGAESAISILNYVAAKGAHFSVAWIGHAAEQFASRTICRGPSLALNYLTDSKEISKWLQATDIFLTTTFYENFPISIIEAMACACAILARQVGGIPEMISHGHNGLLFNNDEEGASRLLEYLTDHKNRYSISQNAAETVRESFSYEKVAQQHLSKYLETRRTKKQHYVPIADSLPSSLSPARIESTSSLSREHEWLTVFLRNRFHLWLALGYNNVALFGAGNHTRWLLDIIKNFTQRPEIICVVEDHPREESIAGIPILTAKDFRLDSVSAIVPSTDAHFTLFNERCKNIANGKIPVLQIYEGAPKGPYEKALH